MNIHDILSRFTPHAFAFMGSFKNIFMVLWCCCVVKHVCCVLIPIHTVRSVYSHPFCHACIHVYLYLLFLLLFLLLLLLLKDFLEGHYMALQAGGGLVLGSWSGQEQFKQTIFSCSFSLSSSLKRAHSMAWHKTLPVLLPSPTPFPCPSPTT